MSETKPSPGSTARHWWRELQPRPDGGGGDRAALARLRRASNAAEAAMEPATLDLCRRVGLGPARLGPVAVTAAVLAHVRADVSGRPAARQLATDAAGGGVMSELRFRALMQATTDDARQTAFRRAVALADRKLNVADLAASLLDWTELRRRRWLYAYYDALAPDVPFQNAKDDAA